jgi:hypothetical protein
MSTQPKLPEFARLQKVQAAARASEKFAKVQICGPLSLISITGADKYFDKMVAPMVSQKDPNTGNMFQTQNTDVITDFVYDFSSSLAGSANVLNHIAGIAEYSSLGINSLHFMSKSNMSSPQFLQLVEDKTKAYKFLQSAGEKTGRMKIENVPRYLANLSNLVKNMRAEKQALVKAKKLASPRSRFQSPEEHLAGALHLPGGKVLDISTYDPE